ncbi:MAG: TadE/TadG family type IV pilus assembly protein [Bacteroidales bacterium]
MQAAIFSSLIRAARDRRASVALELAMIFPLLLVIMLGFYEAYMYIRTVAQLERTTTSVANMLGRQQNKLADCGDNTSALNLGAYISAAQEAASPIPLKDNGEIILSAVHFPNGVAAPTVAWQRRSTFIISDAASVLGKQGAAAQLPKDMLPVQGTDDTFLVVELFYRFKPFAMTAPFASALPLGTVDVHRTAYFRARMAGQNVLTSPACTTVLPTP